MSRRRKSPGKRSGSRYTPPKQDQAELIVPRQTLFVPAPALWTPRQANRPAVLTLEAEGEERSYDPKTAVVCLDETGNESFADPNFPMFGLGGWIALAGDVEAIVHQPWREVQALFDPAQLPLHAADLRPSELTNEQLTAVARFFSTGQFRRCAVVLFPDSLEIDANPLDFGYQRLCDQILEHARSLQAESLLIIFEESHRSRLALAGYVQGTKFGRRLGDTAPVDAFVMAKSSGNEGLQVADFIAHTAGATANSHRRGERGYERKDFKAVFGGGLGTYHGITRVYADPSD